MLDHFRPSAAAALIQEFMLLLGVVLVASLAVSCKRPFSIPHDAHAVKTMKRYESAMRSYLSMEKKVYYILHKAGSYQEYPNNLNCPDFNTNRRNPVRDIAALMDSSLVAMEAGGVEIDVHAYPGAGGLNGVYVSHDTVDNKILRGAASEARKYLERNTLDSVIRHFADKKYYLNDKKLCIEIKVPRHAVFENSPPLIPDEHVKIGMLIDTVNAAIADAVREPAERRRVAASIIFISFNYYALEEAARISADRGYQFHIIVATNRPILGRMAMIIDREINWVDEELISRVTESNWIGGIWFDPWGLERYVVILNGINARRKNPCSIYLSVYNLSRADLLRNLALNIRRNNGGVPEKLRHVSGIIFDAQVYADPAARASCP